MPGPSQVAEQEDIISVSPSTSLSSTMTSPPSQPPPSKKKKIDRGTDIDEAIVASLKELRERHVARSAVIDEQVIFGKHFSAILRRFTPCQQAQARLRIEQVLVDIEFPEEAATPAYFTGRY